MDIKETYPRFNHWHFIYFYTDELKWMKPIYTGIEIGYDIVFSLFEKTSEHLAQFFTVSSWKLSCLLHVQCKNPFMYSILVSLLEFEVVEGVFQNRKSLLFCCSGWTKLGHKGIYNIDICRKKSYKQQLDADYRCSTIIRKKYILHCN